MVAVWVLFHLTTDKKSLLEAGFQQCHKHITKSIQKQWYEQCCTKEVDSDKPSILLAPGWSCRSPVWAASLPGGGGVPELADPAQPLQGAPQAPGHHPGALHPGAPALDRQLRPSRGLHLRHLPLLHLPALHLLRRVRPQPQAHPDGGVLGAPRRLLRARVHPLLHAPHHRVLLVPVLQLRPDHGRLLQRHGPQTRGSRRPRTLGPFLTWYPSGRYKQDWCLMLIPLEGVLLVPVLQTVSRSRPTSATIWTSD